MPRLVLALAASLSLMGTAHAVDQVYWEKLPPIPDREGYAGSFAGVHGNALLVAGGANFPDKRQWEGGTKIWYDHIFAYDVAAPESWQVVGTLPRPLGYGVSIATSDGLICIGGSDAKKHYRDVFRLRLNVNLETEKIPRLPKACANSCGARLGNTIYIAGGIEKPDATAALATFWALDLSRITEGWHELKSWDGPGRMLAVAGVHDGAFYLFGGAGLKKGADGKPERLWLRDAHRFKPGEGWTRLADLPRATVAAPTPAPVWKGKLLVIGGDDGTQLKVAPTEHKGFPRDILAFDPQKNAWEACGEVPFSLVTTPSVEWNGRVVIPGGEARPGVRSNEVWSAPLKQR